METDKVNKDIKKTNMRPALYCTYFVMLRECAQKYGYNLAVHGSMQNDFDIVAVPWVEDVGDLMEMFAEFCDIMGYKYSTGLPYASMEQKPHGRVSYTLNCGAGLYLDIAVMPVKS